MSLLEKVPKWWDEFLPPAHFSHYRNLFKGILLCMVLCQFCGDTVKENSFSSHSFSTDLGSMVSLSLTSEFGISGMVFLHVDGW